MVQQGEEAMLQNAAATGGLRGGNLEGALASFRPQVLSELINQQYARLGGLTSIGQSAAGGVGAAGLRTGDNVAALLSAKGDAAAAMKLANGNMWNTIPNAIMSGLGTYMGAGGLFGGTGVAKVPSINLGADNYTRGYVGGQIVY
jgi:hypothetical protein